jgi:ATP-binding cassette, subfamily B, bacterial PglK
LDYIKNIKDILLTKQINYLFYIFLLMVVNSFLEAFSIGMLLPIFSIIFEGSNSQISVKIITTLSKIGIEPKIEFFLIFVSLIFFLKYSFTIFFTKVQTSFILNLKAELSSRLFKDYLFKSLKFHTKTSSATLVRNIDKEVGIYVNNFVTPIMSYVLATLTISFILILLLLVNVTSTILLMLIFGLIYFIIIKLTSHKLRSIGTLRQHHDKFSLKYIYEAIRTIIEVKLLELENYYRDKFFFHVNRLAKISTTRAIIGILPKIIFESTLLIIIFYLIYYYTLNNLPIDDLIGQIIIYMTASFRIMPALNSITSSHQKIKYGLPASELLKNAYEEIDIRKYSKKSLSQINDLHFENIIELKNISFGYEKDKKILNNLNIKIKKNQTIGIKGKNGTGKSTLVKIICGLLDPIDGNLLVDNKIVNSKTSDWKKKIGYIPQDINLIEGTIKKNICLSIDDENFDETKLNKIIDDVQLRELINKLPLGINTNIGEMGSDISGGERQKIGISKALYRNPEILIFDESTSSLDDESEKKFIELLETKFKNKTKIIISHRLGAFKFCDEIYDLSDFS